MFNDVNNQRSIVRESCMLLLRISVWLHLPQPPHNVGLLIACSCRSRLQVTTSGRMHDSCYWHGCTLRSVRLLRHYEGFSDSFWRRPPVQPACRAWMSKTRRWRSCSYSVSVSLLKVGTKGSTPGPQIRSHIMLTQHSPRHDSLDSHDSLDQVLQRARSARQGDP